MRTRRNGGWQGRPATGEEEEQRKIICKYGVRARLSPGEPYRIPCNKHSHCGFDKGCIDCRSFTFWPSGEAVSIPYSDVEPTMMYTPGRFWEIIPPANRPPEDELERRVLVRTVNNLRAFVRDLGDPALADETAKVLRGYPFQEEIRYVPAFLANE